jgi:hypothetical protein
MSIVVANLGMLLGLGSDAAGLTFLQISLRGVVVFVAALVIVRCGDRRFLSQNSVRCRPGVHPCIDACSRRQRYRSILPDARR